MNRRWCVRVSASVLLFVVPLAAAGCAPQAGPSVFPSAGQVAPTQLRVRLMVGGKAVIRRVALEDYVRGSIISEFAPASGDARVVGRMLEVQAVLSRTYAVSHLGRHARDGYDLCATTHCQLYEPTRLSASRWAPAAEQAVRRTARSVLWFERDAAATLFHADCGGHTSTPTTIWGGVGHPYLRAIADDGPAKAAHASWRYAASDDAIRLALNADSRTTIGSRLTEIAVAERDEAGRAVRVRIKGQHTREVRGEVLRDALTRAFGARAIRSTWFSVRKERATWVFEGRGFGHGAGLCQAGALARITAGSSPSAVLLHYFPGTRLTVLR
jgi:stage II sporulation protein D